MTDTSARTWRETIADAVGDLITFCKRLCFDGVLRKRALWWYVIVLTFCFLSAFIVVWIEGVPDTAPTPSVWRVPLSSVLWALPLVALLSFVAGLCCQRTKAYQRLLDGAFEPYLSRSIRRELTAAVLLVAILMLLACTVFRLGYHHPTWEKLSRVIFANPGGLFALITGFATMVGTYIAIHSVLELKHTITSFPQLIDRVTHLIDENTDQATGVLFLAYTPLTGSWNAGHRTSVNLEKAMGSPDKKIRVACLKLENGSDHWRFLQLFKDKYLPTGKITEDEISEYHSRCNTTAKILRGNEYDRSTKKKKSEDCKFPPVELSDEQMPDYYFFVSPLRAIVAIPMGMPTLKHPINDERITVQTLGFETTDRQIIEMLQKQWERYAGTINNAESRTNRYPAQT